MRIVILTKYPLTDNKKWKQDLLDTLKDQHELSVIYGGNRLRDYLAAYLRRKGEVNIKKRLTNKTQGSSLRTISYLDKNRIPYYKVNTINSNETISILDKIKPDYGIVALDEVISSTVLQRIGLTLNAHYGNLPAVKGWNASEWSLLVYGHLSVTLHRVIPQLDSGDIYYNQPVSISEGDDLEDIRSKCQSTALYLYQKFFSNPEGAIANARPNIGGKHYYRMNKELLNHVISLIQKHNNDSPHNFSL